MPSKRRQLSTDPATPLQLDELHEIATRIHAQHRERDGKYSGAIEWANSELGKFERGYLAGYLAALRCAS